MLIVILSVLLGSPSYPVRAAAHDALALLAAPADMLPLLDHIDPEVQARAAMLLDDLAGRDVRRRLASFAGLPYIDADPEWTLKGHQRHLAAAMAWHREHNLPVGGVVGLERVSAIGRRGKWPLTLATCPRTA